MRSSLIAASGHFATRQGYRNVQMLAEATGRLVENWMPDCPVVPHRLGFPLAQRHACREVANSIENTAGTKDIRPALRARRRLAANPRARTLLRTLQLEPAGACWSPISQSMATTLIIPAPIEAVVHMRIALNRGWGPLLVGRTRLLAPLTKF